MTSLNVNTPEYWNQVYLEEWESGRVQGDCYHRDYGPIHDAVLNLIPQGQPTVLDIACGAGVLCRKIKRARPGAGVLGIDFAEYMIERNREQDSGLDIEYRCLDIRTDLGSLARPFDVVCMCEILEHLEEPQEVVATAFRLLKPGGRFILTCPHDNDIPDHEHVRVWGHDDVFHLLAAYAREVTFVHFPPPWFHIWMMAYVNKPAAGTK